MGVILLRHTRPEVAPGLCYGQTDLPLADSFETELDALWPLIPPIDRILTSPLVRCQHLAEQIARRLTVSVQTDARLMEMDFGAWEGRSWSTIPRAEIDAWAADVLHARPHGGETVAEFMTRAHTAVHDYAQTSDRTLLVTHKGVIRAVLSRALNDPQAQRLKIEFGALVCPLPQRAGRNKTSRPVSLD
ncbi:MAG: alpha-ribazole phosphatase [Maricaulaceae bacterium]